MNQVEHDLHLKITQCAMQGDKTSLIIAKLPFFCLFKKLVNVTQFVSSQPELPPGFCHHQIEPFRVCDMESQKKMTKLERQRWGQETSGQSCRKEKMGAERKLVNHKGMKGNSKK